MEEKRQKRIEPMEITGGKVAIVNVKRKVFHITF
jgi:hypothetical protein